MRETRFLFLHAGEFDPTVLDSQVVDSIVAVAEHGIRFDMAVLMHGGPYLRKFAYNRQRQREVAERIGGSVRVYLTPRKTDRVGDTIGAWQLAFELARGRAQRTVIHARGDTAGFYASRVRKGRNSVRAIYDARGDVEAEARHFAEQTGMPPARLAPQLAAIQRHRAAAVAGADHLLCVSTALRDLLISRHDADPARFSVVACLADEKKFHLDEAERVRTRRALGWDDRFVVIFPGRFGRWHQGPEMTAVVAGLMQSQPDVFFQILTPDVEEARRIAVAALPEGRYDVRSVTHAEVAPHLRAADLGLLLREAHPLNAVACPTKFAEYMMSGLPVLISPGIGDCSVFVAAQDAGVVLANLDPGTAAAALTRLRSEPAAARRERIAQAAAGFSRQRAAREMAALYRRLADD